MFVHRFYRMARVAESLQIVGIIEQILIAAVRSDMINIGRRRPAGAEGGVVKRNQAGLPPPGTIVEFFNARWSFAAERAWSVAWVSVATIIALVFS